MPVSTRPLGAARSRRVLMLRALGLGDFLTAIPAYRAVRRAFECPEHQLLLAAPKALESLARWEPSLDGLIPCRRLAPLRGLPRIDLAVNLHGAGPDSHRVLTRLEPARLIAFRHPEVDRSADGPVFDDTEHDVTRWCRLLSESGIRADPDELDLEIRAASPVAPGYAVVHPGAGSAARRWPAERFALVARALAQRGHRVLVTGSASERTLAHRVTEQARRIEVSSWAGRLDLGGLAALVRHAELVVCGDTGIAHLATAVRTPSVVLFGPVPPAFRGPPPARRIHRAIHRGGSGDPRAADPDPRLLEIDADEVIEAIDGLPESGKRSAPASGESAGAQ